MAVQKPSSEKNEHARTSAGKVVFTLLPTRAGADGKGVVVALGEAHADWTRD